MAAGAGDVRLQLGVTLDLPSFRAQLGQLAQAAAAYRYPINIDKKNLDRQLQNIDRQFARRNYRLEVITNFAAEIENANKLINKIQQIKQAAQGTSGAGRVQSVGLLNVDILRKSQSKGGLNKPDIEALYESLAIAGLEGFKRGAKKTKDQMLDEIAALGRDTVAGLLNGLGSGNAALEAAAKNLGNTLIATFKSLLGIASPSKVFRGFGENVGEGFEQGAISAMNKAFDALENLTKQRLRILDTIARGAFRMLGMDPAAMLAQERQKRLPPAINWPSEVPRKPFTGPSSTGRMLSPGLDYGMLPGFAAVNQKRLVGDILSPSLKIILRDAANAFADAVRAELNAAVRSVKVQDFGSVAQLALAPGRIAGLLPQGVGRTPSAYSTGFLGRDGETREEMLARREREARMRSALRSIDVMAGDAGRPAAPYSYAYRSARPLSAIVPYAAPGAIVSQPGGVTGGGAGGGTGGGRPPGPPPTGGGPSGFMRAMADVKLPGSGVIRELGTEFAFATKQVLLFGQAYKLLAFLQNFPAEVGAAVGQLQSFRNTLSAISPSAKEAALSNQFILDIVDRYNIPLQSARDGFAKLYASMAPAGFKGEEIRNLFTGISQAAATFGMSSDKVDRVNYAFAQMASKGQVMSEELKGQLGDVLPGAMAIFAEAAGFKGPEAITKFSKALEDGAYKGDAMRQLLLNVGIVMRKEFGPGAEGAARTFQGVINRMQNSMKLLYESFEPVAVGFLNTVVMPLTNGIKTITDGFNAFFTGTQAKTAGGMAFAQQLAQLKPVLEGIGNNLKELVPTFQLFGNILLGIGKLFAVIAANPITGFLLKVYANVLLLNTVFTLLGGRILAGLIASTSAAIARFIALNLAVASLQRTSAVTNSTLAGTQLQMALLTRNATASLGPLAMLRSTLAGIAAFGVISVAVAIGVSGLQETIAANAELQKLRQRNATGGATAMLRGATKEEVGRQQGVARKVITNEQQKLQQLNAPGARVLQQLNIGGVLKPFGIESVVGAADKRRLAEARIRSAQDVLSVSMAGRRSEAPALPSQVPSAIDMAGGDGKKGKKGGADKTAKDAERLREQIAQQAQAASDALFAEQQRLLVLQQTNPISESIAKYTSQEAIIQRELNMALKEAKSDKEKADLKQAASIKSAANVLELEKSIKDVREQALKPIEDLIANQREQLAYQADYQQLLANGINPEIAKQVADVRKIVRDQLAVFDTSIKNAKTAIAEAEARGASADQVARLRKELQGLEDDRKKAEDKGKEAEAGIPKAEGPKTPSSYIQDAATAAREELAKLTNWGYQVAEGGKAIGSAFAQAFKDIVSGSVSAQEALANMMQSIASHFFDMAAQIIAQQITMVILGTILKALGVMGGGGFSYGGPNYSSSFNTTPGTSFGGALQMPKLAANGAVWEGGFTPFANGGIVNGPTLGLVGEGRYNEAIVPLPNGRSIPVQLQGDSLRDKMSGNYGSSPSPTVLSMNFETTSINGVEYVSREQLEAAMMETRRAAVKEGSAKGASLAIDKLQQSPNTRRRVGMR